MIEFYLGESSTGKSYEILKQIKHYAEKGYKVIYLVPEQYNLQAEKDLIQKMNLDGLINIDVLSFDWLSNRVIQKTGGLKEVEIDEFGKNMVLRKLFEEEKNNLSFYTKSANKFGFIQKFSQLFSKIKINGLDDETLEKALSASKEDTYFEMKTKDIYYMYERYETFLKNKYFDESDKLNYLLEHIESTSFFENSVVFIDEFSGFNVQQLKVIEKIFQMAKRTIVALCLNPTFEKVEPFNNVRQTYLQLQEIVEHNYLAHEVRGFINIKNTSQEIQFLTNQIYEYSPKQYDVIPEGVKGAIGTNIYEELEMVSEQIVKLIRSKEIKWKEIAVICPDLDTYKIGFKSVFEAYNIPYFIDKKQEIFNNPLIQFIISLLKMYEKHFRYKEIFSLVKTDFTNLTKDEAEILENYVLEYGIRGNLWFSTFTRGSNDLSEKQLEEINEIRRRFIEPFESFKETFSKSELDISEFTIKLYEFIKEYGLEIKLEEWIFKLREEKVYEQVNENIQIWNIIMNIFDQFVELFNAKKMTLKEYIRVLEEGFKTYEIGILPMLKDEVFVGDIYRSKLTDIKALFIVGINDGLFPQKIDSNGIFSDEEKKLLKANGLDLKNDREYKIFEENYKIYKLLSKPSEFLMFSYSLSDLEGKALRPSILIDKVENIFPKMSFEMRLFPEEKDALVAPIPALSVLIEKLQKGLHGKKIEPLWFELYHWYKEKGYLKDDWLVRALYHNNQLKNIDRTFVEKLYELPLKTSVTRLNTFVECPFKHFVKYGLKPKELKEYTVDFPDLGYMFHRSIEEFSKRLYQEKLTWREIKEEQIEAYLYDIIGEVTDQYYEGIFNDNYRNKYFKKKIMRVVKRSITTLREHILKGEFNPTAFELDFSLENGVKPIVIELSDGNQLIVEGRIDRLDTYTEGDNTYIKIIDYKSGSADFDLSDIYYGTKLQLMVYLDALMRNAKYFGMKEVIPAGVYYFKINDPIISYDNQKDLEQALFEQMKMSGLGVKDLNIIKKIDSEVDVKRKSDVINVRLKKNDGFYSYSDVIEKEDFNLLLDHVRSFTKEVGNEILKGKSTIRPIKKSYNRKACDYCDYKSICQFDQALQDNEYRVLQKMKTKEVLKKLREDGDIND